MILTQRLKFGVKSRVSREKLLEGSFFIDRPSIIVDGSDNAFDVAR